MKKPTNLPASIRQRLLDRSKRRGEDYNYTLSQYAIERFLYRLGQSAQRDAFVLKGAALFCIWSREPHRATWDLDLLSRGAGSIGDVERLVRSVCAVAVEDDGLIFDATSVHGEPIRAEEEYEGVRVRLVVHLGDANIPLQIDVGIGDVVTPAPQLESYPAALDQPTARVLAYPRATVVAEKLEAAIKLGMRNSSMKDFYDLHYLATHFAFTGGELVTALERTVARRKTPMPVDVPVGLSDEFADLPERAAQWRAFIRRSRLSTSLELRPLLAVLRGFLLPVLDAVRKKEPLRATWHPSGPWS